jgi:hypothetical protein
MLGERGCELRARGIRASRLRVWARSAKPAVVFGQPVRLHLTGNGARMPQSVSVCETAVLKMKRARPALARSTSFVKGV